MSRDAFEKEVVANLRACLISTQGKCDLRQINRDYRLLMGGDIPYSRLGYKALEDFICNVPALTTTRLNGVLLVDAKITEKSSHISEMVNRQKTRKRRQSVHKAPRHYSAPGRARWQPRSIKKTYQSSPRPVAVKHNQFINIPSPPRESTISARLASRLGPIVNKENVKPNVPLAKRNSAPLPTFDTSIDDTLDSIFTKNRLRITKKMAGIDISDTNDFVANNAVMDGTSFAASTENTSLKYYPANSTDTNSPKTAPSERKAPFLWPNQLVETQIDKEFITPASQPKPAIPFETTGDYLFDIKKLALFYSLDEPQIKVIMRKAKSDKQACYDCQIKIGKHSYSSYPKDCFTEIHAQQEAARLALDDLMPIYSQQKSFLISDDVDILERIPPMVQSHYHGIWKDQLEADYMETYLEQLPVNWLDIVNSLPHISVTPCLAKFVLRLCKPGEKGMTSSQTFVSNISVPTNTVAFDDTGTLLAEITYPTSASEIWCRQINTPKAKEFDEMVELMEQYYNNPAHLERVTTVDVGGYYVALAVSDHAWCRVRVFDITDEIINCFCIDFGDELNVPRNDLYTLHRQFARDQAQAFICRLAGLEHLYEESKSSEYIKSLYGKIVYVHAQSEPVTDKADGSDSFPSVVLVDVDEDVVINEQLLMSIENSMYTAPGLKNTPIEAFLTHAEDSGIVYIQVPYFGNTHLATILRELQSSLLNGEFVLPSEPVTRENSPNKLYFVECEVTHNWYRAKILEWSPGMRNYAQIQFVDYGTTMIVDVTKTPMFPLDQMNDVVVKFDDQAKPARIALRPVPNDFGSRITKLIPSDQSVLVKVTGYDSNKIPLVTFYKRSEPDNLLFSINDAIASENEIRNSQVNGNSQSAKMQKLKSLNQFDNASLPSTGILPCPPLPALEDYLDVKIPTAVNPYNFFVQPYSSNRQLNILMKKLQERCKNIQYSPLSVEDIIPGNIYASRYETGDWCRTSVIKVIHHDSISVFYCDFGFYTSLTVQQLVPLDEEFLTLPYQAIKAKLSGIVPKHDKWLMDDCIFFKQLVCEKLFVSLLMGIEKDTYSRADNVLVLKLVDTSTDVDVFIDKVLINKGIAVAAVAAAQ